MVHGLGLGVCLQALASRPEVEHVLVIEKSEDVRALVAPHYRTMFGDKVQIDLGDAFTWRPQALRFDFAWHDIWDDLCTDNLEEMATLHRRFGRRVMYQDSWGKGLLQRQRRHEKRNAW